jgi:hypothetical protein
MIDEQAILTAERLHDDLIDFRQRLRNRYPKVSRQVTSGDDRKIAARLAEIWLVELATNPDVGAAIGAATLAELSVHFQRILTFSEHATTRSRYDAELRRILKDYSVDVVLPVKQSRGRNVNAPAASSPEQASAVRTAFVGQSFAPKDKRVNQCVRETLTALGVKVVTGDEPKAASISEKVKRLIEDQSFFVGVFTRRDKVARKQEWTTSAWVIDEKAYALGLRKRLVLLKEQGVVSIGGIQGDYEYVDFSRDELETLALRLIQLFDLTNNGLRK